MTKEFEIPIILNHQLNRNITDRKLKNPTPQLSDLNQAGEKAATQVWAITHQKNTENKILQSKISMLKNRNGPRIEFPVLFLGSRMLFTNPAKESDEQMHYHEGESAGNQSPQPYWAKD
jgi:replicative DNA helicase